MCTPYVKPVEFKPEISMKLLAPCGKEVMFSMPDVLPLRGSDSDIANALGTLFVALGYQRRGWELSIITATQALRTVERGHLVVDTTKEKRVISSI